MTRYDRRDRYRRELEISYAEYFEQDVARIYTHDQISNALTTRIYQMEIKGKEETGYGLQSVPILLKTLADLSVRAGRYKGAEDCYKKAFSLTQRRREGDLAWIHAYSALALALVFEVQGRRDEAIFVLETSSKPSMPYSWEIDFNIVLTRLRIAERRFDAVFQLNLPGTLAASKSHLLRQMNQETSKAFCETLPMALLEEGRLDDSIQLQRQIINSSTGEDSTEGHLHARRARDGKKLRLCLTMLDGDVEQVQEASSIVAELRDAYEDDDVAMLEIQPMQAVILAKQGVQTGDVLGKPRESLEAMEAQVPRTDVLKLGCMDHLADTLTVLLEEDEPLSMQFSLHDLCTRVNDLEDRASIISLMVTMSFQGCLKRSIKMIEAILDAGFLGFSDLLTMQCHQAFILSTEGLAFENLQLLEKTFSTISSVRSESQVVFEGTAEQRLHVERIFASVLSKMYMFFRSLEHDDPQDLKTQATQAHASAVYLMTAAWGNTTREPSRPLKDWLLQWCGIIH